MLFCVLIVSVWGLNCLAVQTPYRLRRGNARLIGQKSLIASLEWIHIECHGDWTHMGRLVHVSTYLYPLTYSVQQLLAT